MQNAFPYTLTAFCNWDVGTAREILNGTDKVMYRSHWAGWWQRTVQTDVSFAFTILNLSWYCPVSLTRLHAAGGNYSPTWARRAKAGLDALLLPCTPPSLKQAAASCWPKSKLYSGSQQHHLSSAIGICQDFEVVVVLKMRKHKELPQETGRSVCQEFMVIM